MIMGDRTYAALLDRIEQLEARILALEEAATRPKRTNGYLNAPDMIRALGLRPTPDLTAFAREVARKYCKENNIETKKETQKGGKVLEQFPKTAAEIIIDKLRGVL